jgi:hypothetical protein
MTRHFIPNSRAPHPATQYYPQVLDGLIVLGIITDVPALTMWLPNLVYGN